MEVEGFRHAVSLGLGRAVLHVSEQGGRSFVEVILDACLHTKARDPQVEGSRAQYMLDIVRRASDPSFYTRRILDALSEEADGWDALQRFQIASLLAQMGNDQARQRMIEAFERQSGSSMQDAFAEEFISLDGVPGLLFAVERIGRGLRADSERWVDDYLLSLAQDSFGAEAVSNSITERAKTDANVSAYVEAVNANRLLRAEYRSPDPSSFTYAQIRSMIEGGKTVPLLPHWGVIADAADLTLAADDLTREVGSARLVSYLCIFRKRAFPLGCDHLLRLASLPDVPVARHALIALENVSDDKVRELAITLVEARSPHRGYAVGLLTNNFREGDHELVKAWCNDEGDPEILNSFDRGFRTFFMIHPNDPIEGQILTGLYDREPCSHCRYAIVKRLLQLERFPEELRIESAYDSDLQTRALVNAQ